MIAYYIWGAIAVILILFIFYPKIGLIQIIKLSTEQKSRELIEDTLKHLLNFAHEGRNTSLASISKSLNLSDKKAERLVGRMKDQNLISTQNGRIALTADGERWALQVVRAHRLWEKYLVDEARLSLEKIHKEAHRREHRLTQEELEYLEAKLGYPEKDPHGDPIPDRKGEFESVPGIFLGNLELNTPAEIIHIEDEPPLAYAQILAQGIKLGQIVRLLQIDTDRIILTDGVNEFKLAPTVANNIQVKQVEVLADMAPGAMRLVELPDREVAEVIKLDDSCQGFTRRRLLDLGITPGARIIPEMRNFAGDPRAYRIRGTLIALRTEQASDIWVRQSDKSVN